MSYKKFIITFITFVLFFVSSCSILKPNAGKLYETFYTGEEGIQYFIKPLKFKNKNSESVKLDVTFRYKDDISPNDSAIVNFSITSNQLIKNTERLVLKNSKNNRVNVTDVKQLFIQRKGKQYLSRFSGKTPLSSLSQLFKTSSWAVSVTNSMNEIKFLTNSSTEQKIKLINHHVFELIR